MEPKLKFIYAKFMHTNDIANDAKQIVAILCSGFQFFNSIMQFLHKKWSTLVLEMQRSKDEQPVIYFVTFHAIAVKLHKRGFQWCSWIWWSFARIMQPMQRLAWILSSWAAEINYWNSPMLNILTLRWLGTIPCTLSCAEFENLSYVLIFTIGSRKSSQFMLAEK